MSSNLVSKFPGNTVCSLANAALSELGFNSLVKACKVQDSHEWIFELNDMPVFRIRFDEEKLIEVYTPERITPTENNCLLVLWHSKPSYVLNHPYAVANQLATHITEKIIQTAIVKLRQEWEMQEKVQQAEAEIAYEQLIEGNLPSLNKSF